MGNYIKIGIYKITSPANRVYIGQSTNIKKRILRYKRGDCKTQPKVYRSFKKYGIENHKFEIIEICYKNELSDKERYYQGIYNSVNKGLNCMLAKNSDYNGRHSKESNKKNSESQKGEKSSWWGRKHTEATRKKMREWQRINGNALLGKTGELCVHSKIVLDLDSGIFYESAKEASILLNIKYSTLRCYLNGWLKNKTSLIYV